MIQADELSIAYSGEPVFDKISFTLQKKERCGLLGRNGSGKSTLLRLLVGKESPDSGRVVLPKGYRLGYLDQHIRFTQPTLLEEGALGLPPEQRDELYRVEAILFGLGFKEEDLDKSPTDFSGGYQLRLHLCKVLVSDPDCLLLDEPTNYLDIVSIRWFTRFLQQWKKEFILITHDREFMDSVTTHIMGIHAKKLKKIQGNTTQFFEQILQDEENYERARLNQQKKREHLQSFVDRFGAKATKAAQANARKKAIARMPALEKLKELYHLSFNFNEAPFMGKKILEAKDLSFSYESNTPLIENVSLTVEKGQKIALIGKNGRGKSTLLQLLAKELTPASGALIQSENTQIGYFGQTNIDRLHPSFRIEEEIALANPDLNFTQVKSICGAMMFSGDVAKKPISVLSGGERSRVLLGKILAKPCNLLFLDEPTHHLDVESIEALIDAIEEFEGAVLIVTHSELILKRLALDQIVICHQGYQELFTGSYEEFLDKVGWEEDIGGKKPKKSAISPQELKTQRAQLVTERAAVLKPLEKKIQELERKIMQLEKEQETTQNKLLNAVEAKSLETQALLKTTGQLQKEIETLFLELEENHEIYQAHAKTFEEKLKRTE